jgi:hypothetical protein
MHRENCVMGLRILQLRNPSRTYVQNYVIHMMPIGTSILYNAPTSAPRYDMLVELGAPTTEQGHIVPESARLHSGEGVRNDAVVHRINLSGRM